MKQGLSALVTGLSLAMGSCAEQAATKVIALPKDCAKVIDLSKDNRELYLFCESKVGNYVIYRSVVGRNKECGDAAYWVMEEVLTVPEKK